MKSLAHTTWFKGGSQEAKRGSVGKAVAFGKEIPGECEGELSESCDDKKLGLEVTGCKVWKLEKEGIGTVPGDESKEVSMARVTGRGCGTDGDAALRGGALAENDESTGFSEGPFCVSSNRTCREWYSLLVVGSKHLYAF
ncbi:hypothetical protein F0562_025153 [Nyssa sinensis]|uniref:Uncharacterized protein n=1 Tax=Nyssa sinensis TaxID=561372 RepID=A0A5J5BG28_9ASTE|nr:hypothetical protein F0562_025153 [Nyssa sinensis]